jgi:hypothetical protein
MNRWIKAFVILVIASSAAQHASAMISGGVGNQPLNRPGWPKGAAAVFDLKGRVAWWEGPPFGGGQWHSECRGDAKTLSAVLADFAKIDVKTKRIVLHDGTGNSFWLAPNREVDKLKDATIDWVFMVWEQASWERLHKMPPDLNPTEAGDTSAPTQLDVYTGRLRWSDVIVPPGLTIIDNRLESHGFKATDGSVLEGNVTDLVSKAPIASKVRLEKIEAQKKGGYLYATTQEVQADAKGRWIIKNAPSGWFQIVVTADGYVPRITGYLQNDAQPRWASYGTTLAKAAALDGQVKDDSGQPLADVEVRFYNIAPTGGDGRYQSPETPVIKTDAQGRFRNDQLPQGTTSVQIHKPGYVRAGLGPTVKVPGEGIDLVMNKSATIEVIVEFPPGVKPGGYIVMASPEGGDKIGSYGGSGSIDPQNKMFFKDFPAGRYIIKGRPNPGSERETTESVLVDLKAGKSEVVRLKAK